MESIIINNDYFGEISLRNGISFVITSSLIFVYLYSKNFILNNLIALSITFFILKVVKMPNLKIITYLLVALFFYDIYWVFYSSEVFGESVMMYVAT